MTRDKKREYEKVWEELKREVGKVLEKGTREAEIDMKDERKSEKDRRQWKQVLKVQKVTKKVKTGDEKVNESIYRNKRRGGNKDRKR